MGNQYNEIKKTIYRWTGEGERAAGAATATETAYTSIAQDPSGRRRGNRTVASETIKTVMADRVICP